MHHSKLPLTAWFWAAYLMATHSNGISALIAAFISDPGQAEKMLRAQCSSRISPAMAPIMTTV
jgi:hypothetical protein